MNDATAPIAVPPRPPVEGKSVWYGPDLAARPGEWTHTLSPAEIAEVEAAVRAVQDLDIAAIARTNFPLPTLGPVLDRIRAEVLNGRGFALLRGLPVDGKPIAWSGAAYFGIGSYFGSPRSQNAKGHILGHVRDMGLATTDPNVRTYQTPERQYFHTDSCDIVSLLCLKPAMSGGLSSLTSSMTVYNEMAARRPDLVRRLFAPLPTDRRGEIPEGQLPWFHTPIYHDHQGLLSAIYSPTYVRSSQRLADAPRLTPQDYEALDLFDSLAEDPGLRIDMQLQAGDIQFVHNHTILHDRTAFVDFPEPENKRHLLRLWLSPPDARALPPAYAQRYGSTAIGDRGGIVVKGTRLHAPLEPV
jgi:hypothetical protein